MLTNFLFSSHYLLPVSPPLSFFVVVYLVSLGSLYPFRYILVALGGNSGRLSWGKRHHPFGKIRFASFYSHNLFTVGKKSHHGGIKGTKFKFTSRDLDVFFYNRTDHYFSQELLLYTEEGKNNWPTSKKRVLELKQPANLARVKSR